MLFQKETSLATAVIKAYEPGSIRLNLGIYQQPILLFNGELQSYSGPDNFDELTTDSIMADIKENPEVMIIGTGEKHQLLPLAIVKSINQLGIAIEAMASREACHTYQVLTFEQRRVCALIFP